MRSRSPPIKGRGWGGVCNFLSMKKIQTPPRPKGTPPFEGRGEPCGLFVSVSGLFKLDSYILFGTL